MDPISQGLLGASASLSLIKVNKSKKYFLYIFIIGFLSGMAADLDVLIRSGKDSLLFLEYHRQFTHSLLFIPFGGLFCSSIFYFVFNKKIKFKKIFLISSIGYATHGLLDGCTSYGTQLLWPFSNSRIAWNNISIIDPLFTVPLLVLVVTSVCKQKPFIAKISFLYVLLYFSFGVFQRERAEKIILDLAHSRQHIPRRIIVKPSFANLILWKSVYEYKGKFYLDAVRLIGNKDVIPGTEIKKLDIIPAENGSVLYQDIKRFQWFSDDYLANHPNEKNTIIDIRYSFIPNEITPLWGIKFDTNIPNRHVQFTTYHKVTPEILKEFLSMVFSYN